MIKRSGPVPAMIWVFSFFNASSLVTAAPSGIPTS